MGRTLPNPYLLIRPFMHREGSAKAVLGVTLRPASQSIQKMVAAGMLEELPGRKYGRIYRASEILTILETAELSRQS